MKEVNDEKRRLQAVYKDIRELMSITLKIYLLIYQEMSLLCLQDFQGSGKSSLAFDTIYAEGQRRYMESLIFICQTVPRSDGKAYM